MKSNWKFQSNAKNEKNAAVLFNRFARQLGGEVDSYEFIPGIGYGVKWTMTHTCRSWSELLLEVLQLAQNVGNGWLLTGDVSFRCDAWCNRARVSGVVLIEWNIQKERNAEFESAV